MAMADEQSLIEDRIAGALLGVTVGDCLGAPLEFKSPDAIKQQWGEHRDIEGTGTFGHPPGVGTDDSDLTFAVARAYRDGFSLEKVADNFISWKRSGPRDVGGATAGGIARLMELRRRSGSELTSAGGTSDRSCGNGSLMRTVAVGLGATDPDQCRKDARDVSALTHAHERCQKACEIYSDLVFRLVRSADPNDSLIDAFRSALDDASERWCNESEEDWVRAEHFEEEPPYDMSPEAEEVINAFSAGWEAHEYSDPNDPLAGLDDLKTTGYVLDGLALSAWALSRSLEVGPEQALIDVVNRGGDADTNGAIVGGILGAAWGTEAWPERWVDKVDYANESFDLATPIYRARTDESTRTPGVPPVNEALIALASTASRGQSSVDPFEYEDWLDEMADDPFGPEAFEELGQREAAVPLWRRLFGLGPKRARPECGRWMPIARARCVLPAGHKKASHHRSVL